LGQTHLLTSFGRAVGFLSDLAMCVAEKRGRCCHFTPFSIISISSAVKS